MLSVALKVSLDDMTIYLARAQHLLMTSCLTLFHHILHMLPFPCFPKDENGYTSSSIRSRPGIQIFGWQVRFGDRVLVSSLGNKVLHVLFVLLDSVSGMQVSFFWHFLSGSRAETVVYQLRLTLEWFYFIVNCVTVIWYSSQYILLLLNWFGVTVNCVTVIQFSSQYILLLLNWFGVTVNCVTVS